MESCRQHNMFICCGAKAIVAKAAAVRYAGLFDAFFGRGLPHSSPRETDRPAPRGTDKTQAPLSTYGLNPEPNIVPFVCVPPRCVPNPTAGVRWIAVRCAASLNFLPTGVAADRPTRARRSVHSVGSKPDRSKSRAWRRRACAMLGGTQQPIHPAAAAA